MHDFNGDGHPDIAALVAQEVEAMYLFLNDGKGVFTQKMVFQGHPLYGHSSFELTDFNGDGRPDFVVTNGDNGEYPSPPKSYHGIRVYLNRGGMNYEKSLFQPLNGAFRALARDYDADGDGDSGLALSNYTYGPDKAIFVPDFLMKTWERSGPPVMILYNTLHSKQAKR